MTIFSIGISLTDPFQRRSPQKLQIYQVGEKIDKCENCYTRQRQEKGKALQLPLS